jgi:hypothetical protein
MAEPARYHFAPASGIWAERFAERIARLAGASRSSTGVLLEWRGDLEGVVVASPGPSGSALIRAAADGVDGRLEPAPRLPGLEGSTGLRLGTFVGGLPVPPGTPREPPHPPGTGELLESPPPALGGSWAVQLHLRAAGPTSTLEGSLRLGVRGVPGGGDVLEAELVARLSERLHRGAVPAAYAGSPVYPWLRREWATGAMRRFRSRPPLRLTPPAIGQLARFAPGTLERGPVDPSRHTIVLGASGSGKTTLLARWGAEAVGAGRIVVAIDVHGDLGPALVALLPEEGRRRVVAVDAGECALPVPGVDVMGESGRSEAPRIVAALRRGSDDGGEVYWGFRLERIFDHFVRLVLEEGGNLRDLYDLLTDDARREAARLSTRDAAQARFLDDLRGILRRNPEFLWPAAARLSKVALVEDLARIVAPAGEGLAIDELLAQGRSMIFRLPLGALGPEGAQLAATLLLARIYFGRTSEGPGAGRPILLLVDEAQTVAPSLLAEILSDGRKFGIMAVVATQYPGRLDGRLRDAAAGAVSTHLVLRTPRAGAAAVAPWVGLPAGAAAEWLPQLSDGAHVGGLPHQERPLLRPPPPVGARPDDSAWAACVRSTAATFGGSTLGGPDLADAGGLLFVLRGRELARRPTDLTSLVGEGVGTPDELGHELRTLTRRGWLEERGPGAWGVTPAGRAYLGELAETGAIRESAEHRELLGAAFRLFARHGERLEIVRQGRFDTRLPDARWRAISPAERQEPPHRLEARLHARRTSWGWRAFGGRDVYVEAEVSGAQRRERILRDLSKARGAGAHCLFLVGDARRGRRIRAVLAERRVERSAVTIWILGPSVRAGGGGGAG